MCITQTLSYLRCSLGLSYVPFTTCYTIYHVPLPTIHNKTQCKLLYGTVHDYSLSIFGCAYFVTLPSDEHFQLESHFLIMLFAWLWTQKDYRYYNLIFKYLCISHHVEFWNHQPVYCLWSFNQSSSNLLYSLILLSPSIASPQKNLVGMPAQGILLFRSFSMYLMCLILILLIYTILSLPNLLIFVALFE